MHCEEAQRLIHSYLDGELDFPRRLEIDRHLDGCYACKRERHAWFDLRFAVREQVPYFSAPPSLAQRVRTMVREQTPQEPETVSLPWRWLAAGTAFALAVALTAILVSVPSHEPLLAQEIVAGHVHSLMADHLTDMVWTDYKTIGPWFVERLGFAPPVEDLASQGFPLVGCRLDYVDGRRVAALVYQRRLHYINLFVWPSSDPRSEKVLQEKREGYNLLDWNQDGMTFWAVSDLANDEMQALARLLRNQTEQAFEQGMARNVGSTRRYGGSNE
jgi:anti-sigma factor RsiW